MKRIVAFGVVLFLAPLAAYSSVETKRFFDAYRNLLSQAFVGSPAVREKEETLESQRARSKTSVDRWFPKLDFQLGQLRLIDYSVLTSGALGEGTLLNFITPAYVSLARWTLTFSMPLYDRQVHTTLLADAAREELAEKQLTSERSSTEWNIHTLLSNYLLAVYRLSALEKSRELAQATLNQTLARVKEGEVAPLEVLRARANLSSVEAKLSSNSVKRFSVFTKLLDYTGRTETDLKNLLEDALPENEDLLNALLEEFTKLDPDLKSKFQFFSENPKDVSEQLARSGPEYQNILAEDDSNQAQARTVTDEQWPSLYILGNFSNQAPNWDQAFSQQTLSKSIGIFLNIPIFRGPRIFSRRQEKEHRTSASEIVREKGFVALRNRAEDHLREVDSLEKSISAYYLAVAQGVELVKATLRRYQLGRTTLLELLTAQNDLVESKIALNEARVRRSNLSHNIAWELGL